MRARASFDFSSMIASQRLFNHSSASLDLAMLAMHRVFNDEDARTESHDESSCNRKMAG